MMEWLDQVTWFTWKEAASFIQMGFLLGVGFSVVRIILGVVGLLFALVMKAIFD